MGTESILADFALRSEKEDPVNIEFAEIVTEPQGKYMRYVSDRGAGCLPEVPWFIRNYCPQVKKQLNTEYSHDRTTGYTINEIHGAFSIKKHCKVFCLIRTFPLNTTADSIRFSGFLLLSTKRVEP